ncbi:MAG: hypothetical protein WA004_12150 [Saprospiraceae bacterium]
MRQVKPLFFRSFLFLAFGLLLAHNLIPHHHHDHDHEQGTAQHPSHQHPLAVDQENEVFILKPFSLDKVVNAALRAPSQEQIFSFTPSPGFAPKPDGRPPTASFHISSYSHRGPPEA